MDKEILLYLRCMSLFLVGNAEATLRQYSTCSMAQSVLLAIIQKVFIDI